MIHFVQYGAVLTLKYTAMRGLVVRCVSVCVCLFPSLVCSYVPTRTFSRNWVEFRDFIAQAIHALWGHFRQANHLSSENDKPDSLLVEL